MLSYSLSISTFRIFGAFLLTEEISKKVRGSNPTNKPFLLRPCARHMLGKRLLYQFKRKYEMSEEEMGNRFWIKGKNIFSIHEIGISCFCDSTFAKKKTSRLDSHLDAFFQNATFF